MTEKRTPKHEEAQNSLPDELKPVFDEFVADYKYAASMRHGAPYVSYIVLADMIRAGWRLAAKPIKSEEDNRTKQEGLEKALKPHIKKIQI